jgi:hypothetical protein
MIPYLEVVKDHSVSTWHVCDFFDGVAAMLESYGMKVE